MRLTVNDKAGKGTDNAKEGSGDSEAAHYGMFMYNTVLSKSSVIKT